MAWNYELNTKLGPLCFTFTKFCILSKLLTYFEDNWIFLCFGSKLTEDFKVFKKRQKSVLYAGRKRRTARDQVQGIIRQGRRNPEEHGGNHPSPQNKFW